MHIKISVATQVPKKQEWKKGKKFGVIKRKVDM